MIKIKIINLKINSTRLLIILSIIVAILFVFLATIKIININNENKTIIMTNENYTSILNDCHTNIKNYLNKEILFSGYIFRADDFSNNQFVIARDMLVNSTQSQIVGFLCTYEKASTFDDNSWVEAKGIVTQGKYNGPIPIIAITSIKKITTPNDVFVFPPKK